MDQKIYDILVKINESLGVQKKVAASEVLMSIVPTVGIAFGFTILFFYFMWQYRIKKELIKSNQYQPRSYDSLRTWSLLMGCLSTLVGLPMTILFIIMYGASHVVLGGVIPLATGLGFLLFYKLSRKK